MAMEAKGTDEDRADDESGLDAISEAVREGHVDDVLAFLDNGGNANLSSPKTGRSLLHIACRQGYTEVASLLLSKGAHAGATTLRHLTPLHLASHQGHLKVARLLLEAWAPVDDRDQAGTSPLHLSAQKGHTDVVRLLLQCGADKDGLDESGWTPLFFASWKGHEAVVRMLLQAGANARASDLQEKSTPLHLACAWGHPKVAKALLEFGADSSAKDCSGDFPDHVIGTGAPADVDDACARELSEIVIGHRTRVKGRDASSSLECVADALRGKVSELEDQLGRAKREHLELVAYSSDENHSIFSAALKPECPICRAEIKEVVLNPCRHLAACSTCADTLPSCPFCACPVQGYALLESTQVFDRMSTLEDELVGLRAQLERFSLRVRDLVTENGDLKLDVRRAKADNSILKVENRALEDRLLARSISPSPPSEGDTAAGSDCGSVKRFYPPARGPVRLNRERPRTRAGVGTGLPGNTHGKNGAGRVGRGGAVVPARGGPRLPTSVVESKDDASDQPATAGSGGGGGGGGGGEDVGAKNERAGALGRGCLGSNASHRSELTVAGACEKLAVARSASARGTGGHFKLSESGRSETLPNVLKRAGGGALGEKTPRGTELNGIARDGARSTKSNHLNSGKDRGGRLKGVDKRDLGLEPPRSTAVPSSREQGLSSDGPTERKAGDGKPSDATDSTLRITLDTLDEPVQADRIVSAGTIERFLSSESLQSRISREHPRSSSLLIRNKSGRSSSGSVGSWTEREEGATFPESPTSMPSLVPLVYTDDSDDPSKTRPSRGTKVSAKFTDTRSTTHLGNDAGGNSFSSQASASVGTGGWSDSSAEQIGNIYSSGESSSEASSSTAPRAWPQSVGGGAHAAYSSDEGGSSGPEAGTGMASAAEGEPSNNTRGRSLARRRQRGGEAVEAAPTAPTGAVMPETSTGTEPSQASRSSTGDSVDSSRSPVALQRLSSAVKVVSSGRAG